MSSINAVVNPAAIANPVPVVRPDARTAKAAYKREKVTAQILQKSAAKTEGRMKRLLAEKEDRNPVEVKNWCIDYSAQAINLKTQMTAACIALTNQFDDLCDEDQKAFEAANDELISKLQDVLDDLEDTAEKIRTELMKLPTQQLQELPGVLTEASKAATPSVGGNPTSASANPTRPSGHPSLASALPKIRIPVFHGNRGEFASFRVVYEHHVHNNPALHKQDKMCILMDHLKGAAKDTIKHFQLHGDNYVDAYSMLCKRYDDPKALIRDLREKFQASYCVSEKWDDQLALVDRLRNIHTQLVRERPGEAMSNVVWMDILNKFPQTTKRRLMERKELTDDEDVKELIDSLEKVICDERDIDASITPIGQRPFASPKMQGFSKDQKRSNRKPRFGDGPRSPEQPNHGGGSQDPSQPIFVLDKCAFCGNSGHKTTGCPNVWTPQDRRQKAYERNLCHNCFGTGHVARDCRAPKCAKCFRKHHVSIHADDPQGHAPTQPYRGRQNSPPVQQARAPEHSGGEQPNSRPAYTPYKKPEGTSIAVAVDPRLLKNRTTVMIDTGANKSFISHEEAERLALPVVRTTRTSVATFGQDTPVREEEMKVVEVTIILRTPDDQRGPVVTIEAMVRDTILPGQIRRPTVSKPDHDYIIGLGLVYSERRSGPTRKTPQLLIGTDYLWNLITGPPIALPSGLTAVRTALGVMLTGVRYNEDEVLTCCAYQESNPDFITTIAEINPTDQTELEQLLLKATQDAIPQEWAREDLPTGAKKDIMKAENEAVLQHFEKTVKRLEDGRYEVQLPFKEGMREQVPSNYAIAAKRLKSTYDLVIRDPDLGQKTDDIFKHQLEKGIIELVPTHYQESGTHYLPHQPVVRPDKDTTKVRIVFDASAHFRGCLSLNDAIHQGPSLLPKILGILLRFRTGTTAIVSDVEKAFLQVALSPQDRDMTRFLWLRDWRKPPSPTNTMILRYRTLPFGINASPYLLGAVMERHLQQYDTQLLPASSVLSNTYVDNVTHTCNTTAEGRHFCKEMKLALTEGGMNLREFGSNNPAVLDAVAPKDHAENLEPKVLGTKWITSTDILKLEADIRVGKPRSKRMVASQAAQVYDPLGLMAPLLVKARLFMQGLWETQEWDSTIPQPQWMEWEAIREDIQNFSKEIPRSVCPTGGIVDMVVFTDASKDAMAAGLYVIQVPQYPLNFADAEEYTQPRPSACLIASKTKLRPVRQLLEQTLMDLQDKIIPRRCALMTDSEITLGWIRQPEAPNKQGTFVENRWRIIRAIQAKMNQNLLQLWTGYVRTDVNPADCATRGLTKKELVDHPWWTGPTYLTQPWSDWPTDCRITELGPEANAHEAPQPDIVTTCASRRLSRWTNIMATVRRFIGRIALARRAKQRATEDPTQEAVNDQLSYPNYFTAKELEASQTALIKLAQQDVYSKKRWKELENLSLFKDPTGVWRCRGRLGNAPLPYKTRFPIFIDHAHPIASMLVRAAHCTPGPIRYHLSQRSTISEVRARYWIPSLRRITRQVIGRCVNCQRYNNFPLKYPELQDLPSRAVTQARPFQHTGLDYFGPFELGSPTESPKAPKRKSPKAAQAAEAEANPNASSDATQRKKAYGLIFACTVTRMIHLELVENMTTVAFVQAVRRFISQKDKPESITCDNAPQFSLAEKILTEHFEEVTASQATQTFFASRDIRWLRITPLSPWQGGFYERLNQDIKRSIYKSLLRKKPSFEELRTIMSEVEAILNQRPLTYLDSSDESYVAIRPCDFYQKGRNLTLELQPNLPRSALDTWMTPQDMGAIQTRLEALEQIDAGTKIREGIWNNFYHHYLTSLRERHRKNLDQGRTSSKAPRVGMIVLINESPRPRYAWPMARIIECPKDKDGQVRHVHVRTPDRKMYTRSVNLLIPLELDAFEEGLQEHLSLQPSSNDDNASEPQVQQDAESHSATQPAITAPQPPELKNRKRSRQSPGTKEEHKRSRLQGPVDQPAADLTGPLRLDAHDHLEPIAEELEDADPPTDKEHKRSNTPSSALPMDPEEAEELQTEEAQDTDGAEHVATRPDLRTTPRRYNLRRLPRADYYALNHGNDKKHGK
ncbi:hypothetical protein L596_020535 [Steinernema carpocapsae]|uniref:Integrase catalytic domain-containing protein n=1 Tax=Steinernema carpocapsae TaxID=34508 RepID=A0A4U5MTU1_STECR|nr:hypothetical protein L596_020535 [Steinernema carpocapsae]